MREDKVIDMSDKIKDKFENISLVVDVMHVNGNAFMVAKSIHIGHISVIPLTGLEEDDYIEAFDVIVKEYKTRGGVVKMIFGDGAFECTKPHLAGKEITFVKCDAKKHVPVIERCIQDVKNRI